MILTGLDRWLEGGSGLRKDLCHHGNEDQFLELVEAGRRQLPRLLDPRL